MARKLTETLNETIKPNVDEGAAKSLDVALTIIPKPEVESFNPSQLYQREAGGATYNDTLSTLTEGLDADPYSEIDINNTPAAYKPFAGNYNRKQRMEREYTRVQGISDPAQRQLEYDKMLMDFYGYDILKSKGHDITSSMYWYKKFLNKDFSNPLYNDYILDTTLYEAEYAMSQYEEFKMNNGFDWGPIAENLANYTGKDVTEEMFNNLKFRFGEDGTTLDYETFMTQARADVLDSNLRAIYDEQGNIKGYVHEDGKFYEVLTEQEYNEQDPSYDVMVMQSDGDLVLNDATGFRQVIGEFGRGVVRSVFDMWQLIRMGAGAVEDLLTGHKEGRWQNTLEAYQQTEGTANDSAWIGKNLNVNMNGKSDALEVGIGVAGFAGQIAGAVALSFLTAGAAGIGIAIPLNSGSTGLSDYIAVGESLTMNIFSSTASNTISGISYSTTGTSSAGNQPFTATTSLTVNVIRTASSSYLIYYDTPSVSGIFTV